MWKRLSLQSPEDADIQEPVTLDEAKEHIIEPTFDGNDDYIFRLIAVARDEVERFTHRALMKRQATMVLDSFPSWSIELPYGKAQSITSIEYYDSSGAVQALSGSASPAVFQVDLTDSSGAVISPLRNSAWPVADVGAISPVTVKWIAGYASAEAIPPMIRHAILGQVAKWYELRWDGDHADVMTPHFYQALSPYVIPIAA
jgi:uncharacterized phiE125 gp8 family phage protein